MQFFTEKRCKRCYIQEDPEGGIVLDEKGICSLCRQAQTEREPDWMLLRSVFEDAIEQERGKGEKYDGVVMMSGGKDSAYLACTLKKKYGLRLIGFINDIHYEYSQTFEGAKNICDKLDMPLYINKFDEDIMRRYFRFLFTSKELRDSGFGHICNYCGRMMIRSAADFAKENGIPMVFSGHNPDQISGMGERYETDPTRIAKQNALREMIAESVVQAQELSLKKDPELIVKFPEKLFPDGVRGLFMYQYFPYKPVEMMEYIKQEIDWKPMKTMSETYIASGCKLAHLWIYLAYRNKTVNYVDKELSSQVRRGTLSKKLVKEFYNNAYDSSEIINEIVADLGIDSVEQLLED
ncbi:MAG: hypothetical protein K6F71_06730 [Ruminococcus sp.]|uniref:hypothetical protein n=1 Tax=Ruminococcus sp. TaxID=41978 RepID=UPI0025D3AEE1|nr:hypothetical protein [Ruminococcus sp.]MCR5540496.1 hypothetical protein [Ruminococcus sp.]